MRDVIGFVNRLGLAGNQKLFRRHRFNLNAAIWMDVGHADVVDHRRHHHLAGHRVHLRLTNGARGDDLDLRVLIGSQRSQRLIVQAAKVVRLEFGLVVPIRLDDANLADQRILKRSVRHQETVIVAVHNKISIISGLLGGCHVFRTLRRIFHGVLGAVEDPHQRRHDRLHSVAHIHGHDLRPAFLFVAERVAAVVLRRSSADRAYPVVHIINGVVDLFADDALQLVLVHRLRQHLFDVFDHVVNFVIHIRTLLAPVITPC